MKSKFEQVTEIGVKATVEKTGRTFYRTERYAKKIITGDFKANEITINKVTKYFLKSGKRSWKEVSEQEYLEALKDVKKREIELSEQLRKRVVKLMRNPVV